MITSSGSPSRGETQPLDLPVSSLRGAGPVTAARLAARGIVTARDLLFRLPRGFDDLRRVTPIAELDRVEDGTVVLVRGTVQKLRLFPRRVLDVFVADGGAVVRARWFRPPAGMSRSFAKGTAVALAGPVRPARAPDGVTHELIQPANMTARLAAGGGAGLGFRPRYSPMEGVRGAILEKLRASALARLEAESDANDELLPAAVRARLGLPALQEALRRVHGPGDAVGAGLDDVRVAERRIVLEQLIVTQLAFLLRRRAAGAAAVRFEGGGAPIQQLFPFALTVGQRRAIDDVARDMGSGAAMQRLLVGDVGSGKTAVAFAAAALVAAAGGQTLMMVPTEVLAEQQARALAPLAARAGMRLAALTSGTPAAARAEVRRAAAAGEIALVVGTQALLDPDLRPARLGLVVVDEQHRFGVAQRAALRRQSGGGDRDGAPHLLAMSATPVPRSLALALHGELDASFLVERPAGRGGAETAVCATADERDAAYAALREAVAAGQQAFVICPAREVARRAGTVTAVAHHGRLRRALAPARVALLHGAMASADKEAALRAFADGATGVLVATTVVELGIDVPNATVMIVEGAERFGLAQLHQLRGRVGRGAARGKCFLVAPAPGGDAEDELPETGAAARARLALMAATDDGFAIAEADLAARGFGELSGTRQAGTAGSGVETMALVATARAEAEAILRADPALARPEHAALARAARRAETTLHAGEAG